MKVEILRPFMKITHNNNNLLNGFLVLVATNRRNVRRRTECFLGRVFAHLLGIKDVRAHCYCASLVHTLYMTWHGRHVFQVRAPARVKNAVRMLVFPASGAYLPLKLYAITKQTRFRPRNSKK